MAASTSKTIFNGILWVAWCGTAFLTLLMSIMLSKGITKLNTFSVPFDLFPIGMMCIPTLICGSLRFWIAHIRNPWLALLPYLLGVFFVMQTALYGVFLVPEFCVVYQALSVALWLLYVPVFTRLAPAIPPALPRSQI
jgi:hypothetical protein